MLFLMESVRTNWYFTATFFVDVVFPFIMENELLLDVNELTTSIPSIGGSDMSFDRKLNASFSPVILTVNVNGSFGSMVVFSNEAATDISP